MITFSPSFVWVLLVLVGVVIEGVLAGSFVGIFCAVGAACTALFTSLGLLPAIWQQCCSFAGVTMLSVALARTPLLRWAEGKAKHTSMDSVVGERARVIVAMAPHAPGEVSLHGAKWRAVNDDTVPLAADAACRVRRIEGLLVYVERLEEL